MKIKQLLKEINQALDDKGEYAWQFGSSNDLIITWKE
jgi:uncharacterized protein YegP (UPF0339 family)